MNKKDWKKKTLGEVCKLYQPTTISTKEMVADGPYNVYGANGIIGRYNKYNHENSEVLLGCRGTVGCVTISKPKSWINGNAMVIHINDETLLNRKFLVYQLLFIDKKHIITGAAQPQITRQTLSPLLICIPPLSEQEEIVKKLDAAFAEIDALKANSESQLNEARALFQAALSKELSPKNNWQKRLIKDCCSIMAGGDVPKDHFSKEKTKQFQVPIFSNGTVNEGLYGFTDIPKITKKSITISGRGTIGFVAKRMEPFYPIVRLIVITPNDEIDVSFLKYYTMSIHLEKKRNGVAIPQLTVPMIKEVDICHPSLSEQEEIVARLDALSDNVRKLEEINRRTIAECDALRQSILRQIFD